MPKLEKVLDQSGNRIDSLYRSLPSGTYYVKKLYRGELLFKSTKTTDLNAALMVAERWLGLLTKQFSDADLKQYPDPSFILYPKKIPEWLSPITTDGEYLNFIYIRGEGPDENYYLRARVGDELIFENLGKHLGKAVHRRNQILLNAVKKLLTFNTN